MADTFLFVGGPADGRRATATGEPVHCVASRSRDGIFCYEVYRLEAFHEGNTRHYIYFHESLKPGQFLDALIKGYRPEVRHA